MTNTLHAHISTASSDCDGPMYRDWVATMTLPEQENESWGEMLFRERMLTNHVSVYSEYGVTVKIDSEGFTMTEPTDEGYRSAEVRFCTDECDETEYHQRDVYAEQMGY